MRLLVQLCAAIGLLLATPANADFAAGIEAYKQKDYRRAIDEWLPDAAENDPRALFNLGQMYRLGLGVDKDINVAEQYYRRAAKQGHAGARGNLASILFSAVPPQIDDALYYWRAAARDGDVRSQFLLGVQYFNGEHVDRDYILAYAWINLAAQAGLDEADNALNVLSRYLGPDDIIEGTRLSKTFMVEPEPEPDPRGEEDPAPNSAITAPAAPAVPAATPVASEPVKLAPQGDVPISKPEPELEVEPEAEPEAEVPEATQPAIEPVAPPVGATMAEDKYRVQIAALRSEADARDYWQRASSRRPDLTADTVDYIERADLGDKGIYFRLQLGHFADQDVAKDYCDQLIATELSCFVVETP